MSDLHRVIHLAATDSAFRSELSADPAKALAQQDLRVSADELALLSHLDHLMALPSQELLSQLLASASRPEGIWMARSTSKRYAASETG